MEIITHGKSGCKIEVLNKDFNYVLRKTSKTIGENRRHVERVNKQIDFYKDNKFSDIKVPEVFYLFEGDENTPAFVDMKYIAGKDSLSFLKYANYEEIDLFIKQICNYLDYRFKKSKDLVYEEDIEYIILKDNCVEKVKNKVLQIEKTLDFPRKNEILKVLHSLPIDTFYYGNCHGDFTLANMIHANGKLYIFDFLDMFVDSPMFDLLSIRQDTHHLWSCFIYGEYSCRAVELLSYIDDTLKKKYRIYIENKWYNYLSLMNYVRMYRMYDTNKKSKELDFIYNCITEYL